MISDSSSPTVTTSVQVLITVQRDIFPPVFTQAGYTASVSQTFPVGGSITSVSATDADGDAMQYALLGNGDALQYFYVTPSGGEVILTRPLSGTSDSSFTVGLYSAQFSIVIILNLLVIE